MSGLEEAVNQLKEEGYSSDQIKDALKAMAEDTVDPEYIADIENECTGLNFVFYPRNEYNKESVGFKLCIEDDGHYHEKDFEMSSFWIDDLIDTLEKAKQYMYENYCKDEWGYYRKLEE